MKKILLPVVFMMVGLLVNAQDNFYFTGVATTGTSQDLDYEATEPAEGGFGDHTDMQVIINPEVDNPDNIAFTLSFSEDAYIKMFAEVPQIGSLEIYTSEGIVGSPLTATSDLLDALTSAPDGEYGLTVTGSTTGEPSEDPAENDPTDTEVLKFTIVIDSEMGVEDQNFKEFSYYPNPVRNKLNLKAASTIDNVALYNVLGQRVMHDTPNAMDTQLNMSSLQSGIYIMKTRIDGHEKSFKVVKD